MTPAERIYQVLLWLYPAKHRRAYGRLMLQHARDLSRAARQRGRWHTAVLCSRLIIDGITNAFIEHKEAIMTAHVTYKPVPWPSVLLAAVPGLWVALSRRHADVLGPLLLVLGGGYILLFVIGLPAMWWRERRFPIWGLMFAGALAWFVTFRLGTGLSQRVSLPYNFGWELGVVILNIVLATVLFVVLLRGHRLPGSVWFVVGIIGLVDVVGAIIYGSIQLGDGLQIRELQGYMMASLALPAEGLMLIAVGLLAARQHGLLALLVVIGGYGYIFMDTDYLFGYPSRDWPGLPLYLVTVSLLYLVLTPVAMLRAKTRRGRALAVFVPVILFLVVRAVVPILITGRTLAALRPGDAGMSLNVLLTLILAWFLYSQMAVSHEAQYDPLPGR